MTETSATALLVGTPDMFAASSNAVTATVPRDEIEEALASEPPADLVLDVLRGTPGDGEPEHATVNVAWTSKDLQAVLGVDSEEITFYFDPEELTQALDAEVEAHGLRETAVVLSIAAAAAVGAGNAFAYPDPGGAGAAQITVHDEATAVERGIGVVTPAQDEATRAVRGIGAEAVAATRDEASLAARGIEAGTLPATHDEATLAARGIGHLAATHDEATLAARGIDPVSVHDEGTLVTRGIVDEAPGTIADPGSGFELPSLEPGTAAALTGGIAGAGLLIAAAAFATRRRFVGHP